MDSAAAALSPRAAGLGRRSVSGTSPRRELRGAAARPAAPLRPPGRGRAPLPPRGARGQGLRHPPHSAGMEGQLDANSFADDVLRVFGANHSLSAGQLSALLQRLGAAPALGSALPLAHLHHNQVPAPRGIRGGSGLGTSRSEAGWAAS